LERTKPQGREIIRKLYWE